MMEVVDCYRWSSVGSAIGFTGGGSVFLLWLVSPK